MAETKKKKAQPVADSPSTISESSTPGIETTAAEPVQETAPADRRPSPEEIEVRAYEIYLARGGEGGSAEDDWLQAERELGGAGEAAESISE